MSPSPLINASALAACPGEGAGTPFDNINKRISSLAANIPLIQRNMCPLSFVDVRQAMNKSKAVALIRHRANVKLPAQDRERFVEVVQTQPISVHLGSIARFRLRPSEFDPWQAVWK